MKKTFLALAVSMLVLIFAVPAFADAGKTWIMIGDSYASRRTGIRYDGKEETLDAAWPDYLEASIGCKAEKVRMGGYGFCRTGKQFITGLKSLTYLDAKKVTNIIVAGGVTNDCWCKASDGSWKEASESQVRMKMLEFKNTARKMFPNARLIYSAVNWGETKYRQDICTRRAKMYRKIALEQGWVYLEGTENALRVPQSLIKNYFFNDNHILYGGFHPNSQGQLLLGRNLAAAVRRMIPKDPVQSEPSPEPEETETDQPQYEASPVLLLKMGEVTDTTIRLRWNAVKGAAKYCIEGNLIRSAYKKIGTTTVTSSLRRNLRPGSCYKFIVTAYDSQSRKLAQSREIIIAMPKSGYTNCSSIKMNTHTLSLRKGRTSLLSAAKTYFAEGKKKCKASVRYISDTPEVAKVSTHGIVTANAAGTCRIYAIAENGICDRVTMTVTR